MIHRRHIDRSPSLRYIATHARCPMRLMDVEFLLNEVRKHSCVLRDEGDGDVALYGRTGVHVPQQLVECVETVGPALRYALDRHPLLRFEHCVDVVQEDCARSYSDAAQATASAMWRTPIAATRVYAEMAMGRRRPN